MQKQASTVAATSIEIAAQSDSPGAEIIELLIGLPAEKHSSNYPIEVLKDWRDYEGGRRAVVSIYDTKRETSYICPCFIGDLSARRNVEQKQFVLRDGQYVRGAYKYDGSSVTLNASRFTRYTAKRKISLGQQIVVQAISQCNGFS